MNNEGRSIKAMALQARITALVVDVEAMKQSNAKSRINGDVPPYDEGCFRCISKYINSFACRLDALARTVKAPQVDVVALKQAVREVWYILMTLVPQGSYGGQLQRVKTLLDKSEIEVNP